MNKIYEPLFTPWKIGNVEIKNRIVLCPMGGTSLFGWMKPNHFDKQSAEFFMERAKQNVGLIIPGIAPIKDLIGGRWLYKNKKMFEELKEYMTEFHKTGAKLFVQLTAGFGRSFSIPDMLVPMAKSKFLNALMKPICDVRYLCASPSELPSRWAEGVMCREITKKEITKMIDAFARTAKMCKEAGVDGVEIHAVHEGYLLDQFTTKYTNHRHDEYGGSFENRYRFPVEIVQAIKKECGADFPVSLRYSVTSKTKEFQKGAMPGEKFNEIGRDMEESEKAAKYLQDAGYDMLNADNGTYDAWYWAHPPEYMPMNCNLEDVSHIRKFVDIPVVCAGRMSPVTAAKAIKDKEIDAMGVARQFLVDGEWVTKLMEDRIEDIQPCICCHNGCFPMSHYKGISNGATMSETAHMARCALNPITMHNHKFDIIPATTKKKVAVIGGGNSAVEEAIYLTKFAKKVYIIHRRDQLRADKIVQERAFKNDKIEFILCTIPLEIQGTNTVENIILKNVETNKQFNLEVNGVFPYIGFGPNVDKFNGQIKQNSQGFIETDNNMQTSLNGVYAAGDVRNTPLRQVITAAADGAVAACSAVKYLEQIELPLSSNV